ncbi:O-antigen ligase family protein [Enterococcus mundtii]|uniref:O-antigen ligase family protein n=1 Tax=Enterococcus mundtii TaxID=53346 RepID=UPI00189AFCE4|nr:O-antigen ligase family protein [Enterococcus mundtii]MDB7100867.1 hypothetical protein [Enterococcus mundtii]
MKKHLSINLLEKSIKALLFLILFSPTIFQGVKLVLILFIISLYLITPLNKVRVNKSVLIWLFLYLATNYFFLILGSTRNSHVFNMLGSVYLIWPFVYALVFIFPLSLEKVKINIFTFSSKVGIVLSLLTIYIYFSYKGIFPVISILDIFFPYNINSYGGYVSYFSPSITSFFFLIPITAIAIFNKNEKKNFLLNCFSLFCMILCALLIGRRALILSTVLIIFLYIIFKMLQRELKITEFVKYLFLFTLIFLLSSYIIDSFNLNLRIFNLDLISQISDGERHIQFVDLVNSWKKNPILGVGYGVNSEHVIRSYLVPGTYELSYVALLFQTGVIGFLIYIALYLWLALKMMFLYIRKKEMEYLAVLLSYISIMIAHGSNPYITSFDGAWIIFFMLALINRDANNSNRNGEKYED